MIMVLLFLMGEVQKNGVLFFQKQSKLLFAVVSSSLEVSHSFIDYSSSSFIACESLSLLNTSNTWTETYRIQYFDSHHCNAEIPLPKQKLENPINRTNQKTTNPAISFTLLNSYEISLVNTPEETFLDSFDIINVYI